MSPQRQKQLAIFAALVAVGLFLVANYNLLMAALRSQPACVEVENAGIPAKRAC